MRRPSLHHRSWQAVLGLVVIALQVLGALHFTLVRHGYSAAVGGVVHVHAPARSEQPPAPKLSSRRTSALIADTRTCSAELCPDGNAPPGSAPHFEPSASSAAAFGEARLLSEGEACGARSLRVFLCAPKTSPPA